MENHRTGDLDRSIAPFGNFPQEVPQLDAMVGGHMRGGMYLGEPPSENPSNKCRGSYNASWVSFCLDTKPFSGRREAWHLFLFRYRWLCCANEASRRNLFFANSTDFGSPTSLDRNAPCPILLQLVPLLSCGEAAQRVWISIDPSAERAIASGRFLPGHVVGPSERRLHGL